MKIIDLLNKIANGEEVPKEIKIKTSEGTIAPFYLSDDEYINNYTGHSLLECLDEFQLTDKILYEEDEFEDIEELKLDGDFGGDFLINDEGNRCHISSHDKTIVNRINKVIKNQKRIIERLKDE